MSPPNRKKSKIQRQKKEENRNFKERLTEVLELPKEVVLMFQR